MSLKYKVAISYFTMEVLILIKKRHTLKKISKGHSVATTLGADINRVGFSLMYGITMSK